MKLIEFFKAHEEQNGREWDGVSMRRSITDTMPSLRFRHDTDILVRAADYRTRYDDDPSLVLSVTLSTLKADGAYEGRVVEIEVPVDFLEVVPEDEPHGLRGCPKCGGRSEPPPVCQGCDGLGGDCVHCHGTGRKA